MFEPGQHIGKYRVIRLLGRGGMGVVYEAIDDQIDRRAAVKVLHQQFSQDRAIARRFFNEARAANIIRHPGIVSISELGELPDGAAYIVMEYLDGESLGERLNRPLPHDESVRLGRQIASALAAAHDKRIVHRDLKPDNVMLVPDPEVQGGHRAKVLDFGIAKLAEQQPDAASLQTAADITMGTPVFMAPEQARGAAGVDDRADVYSLGVILFRMLGGRYPFQAHSQVAWMAAHLFQAPLPLREADPTVSPELAELVAAMLAKEPAQRPSMSQVVTRLDREARSAAMIAQEARSAAVTGTGPTGAPLPTPEPATPPVEQPPEQAHSTLGRAAGQSGEVPISAPGRPRRGALVAGIAAVLLCFGGLLGRVVPHRSPATPPTALIEPPAAAPPTAAAPVEPPAAAPPVSAGSASPVPVASPGERAAPALVRWSITTEPAGAQVVRESDGQVLGVTPWLRQQPVKDGELVVILHGGGYTDRRLVLDQRRDADRHEKLKPQVRPQQSGEQPRKDSITDQEIRYVD